MDVSIPAIRGPESLGRLMGLVMMLIRYAITYGHAHARVCTNVHTDAPNYEITFMREICFRTNINLITSASETETVVCPVFFISPDTREGRF